MARSDFQKFEDLVFGEVRQGQRSSFKNSTAKDMRNKVARLLVENDLQGFALECSDVRDDAEDALKSFFGKVMSTTEADFRGTSEFAHRNLYRSWAGAGEKANASATLAIESYFYLHSYRRGQDLANKIDVALFGVPFFRKFKCHPPGGFEVDQSNGTGDVSWKRNLKFASVFAVLLLSVLGGVTFSKQNQTVTSDVYPSKNTNSQSELDLALESLRLENGESYISHLHASSEQGNPIAAMALGIEYELGTRMTRNSSLSQKYFEQAFRLGLEKDLQSGDPFALYFNGLYLWHNKEGETDLIIVKEMFEQAKVNGYGRASLQIAELAVDSDDTSDDCRGFSEAKYAADAGHIAAWNKIADFYYFGLCVDQSYDLAADLTQKSAELGHLPSQVNSGHLYRDGLGVDPNDVLAVEWYRKAAEQGYARAQTDLGWMYEEGRGVDPNDETAVAWYRKAAEQGYARAQTNLGWMFQKGRGVDPSDETAVAWYRKAAEQGYARAQTNLGWMYEEGRGVDQSYETAVAWYRKAAEQGYARAQTNLGWMYEEGRGVDQSYETAVAWYRKAAEQGFATAQTNLGWMYEKGRGVDPSDETAVAWYRKAAEQGFATAQNDLGWMYEKGRGVDPSDETAVAWYRQAAEQGFATAQTNLGWMYEKGRGVDQSYETAVAWYRKAAEQGYARAQTNLSVMIFLHRADAKINEDPRLLLEDGAASNSAWGHTALGIAHVFEWFPKASLDEGILHCRLGAEQGNHCGQYCLGAAYFIQEKASGLVQKEEAQRVLKQASEGGHVCSTTLLAMAIVFGDFPSVNRIDDAEFYFRLAANQGGEFESRNLGLFLHRYRDQDLTGGTEAFEWFKKSARLGNKDAACVVARSYLEEAMLDPSLTLDAIEFVEILQTERVLTRDEAGLVIRGDIQLAEDLNPKELSLVHEDERFFASLGSSSSDVRVMGKD
ncbi:tetratricopeptide repeat protein [Tateyamaria sp. SN3-11]|uniref:tetratricopeptide repeat protein n=1 Tax=Tateyamaria sp. SN3-11 TaxID=3092147 RepID=UPI0039EB5F80